MRRVVLPYDAQRGAVVVGDDQLRAHLIVCNRGRQHIIVLPRVRAQPLPGSCIEQTHAALYRSLSRHAIGHCQQRAIGPVDPVQRANAGMGGVTEQDTVCDSERRKVDLQRPPTPPLLRVHPRVLTTREQSAHLIVAQVECSVQLLRGSSNCAPPARSDCRLRPRTRSQYRHCNTQPTAPMESRWRTVGRGQ